MGLKYKFDELQQQTAAPNPGDNPAQLETQEDIERYATSANVRTLHLIEINGKQTFLNYSYLISGEFLSEQNTITLTFTTCTVTLKGNNLEHLFKEISAHAIKRIVCAEERYQSVAENTDAIIFKLFIKCKS